MSTARRACRLYSADRRLALLGDEVRRSTAKSSGCFGCGAAARGRRRERRRRRRPNRPRPASLFGRDGLFSGACVTIFGRLAARASLTGRRRPIGGLSVLSPRRQAFSSFSKDFQTFPRKFQGNSKLFQGFPNFFLGRFEGNQGVVGRSSRNRVFSNYRVVSAATSGPAIRRRTRPQFKIARTSIIEKKLSRQFSAIGHGASAASHAPTRKPTGATPAPAQLRQRAPSTSWKRFFPKPRGCQGAKPACGGALKARP